ncbi:MAG TPA: hypothetical protein VHJ20_06345, partial [Polyangia bacterium]|nr:hypothetical protein [Polyangia bacterium]
PRAAPPPPPVEEPAPPPPPPPPPVVVPAIVVVAPPPPPPPERAVWSLLVEAGGGVSPTPGTSARVGVGVERARRRFVATLRLEGWTPADGTTTAPGLSVRYAGAGGSLGACWAVIHGLRGALMGCGSAGIAALRGASSGAATNASAVAPWTTVAPAVRGRVRLGGRWFLDARVEAKVSLDPPRFAVTNLGDVATVPRVVPAGMLGFSVDL